MTWHVPGTKLQYRESDQGGLEWSEDGGNMWYLTFRTITEVRQMWPTLTGPVVVDDEPEREIFGETLDEPIPDDLWEMISG